MDKQPQNIYTLPLNTLYKKHDFVPDWIHFGMSLLKKQIKCNSRLLQIPFKDFAALSPISINDIKYLKRLLF